MKLNLKACLLVVGAMQVPVNSCWYHGQRGGKQLVVWLFLLCAGCRSLMWLNTISTVWWIPNKFRRVLFGQVIWRLSGCGCCFNKISVLGFFFNVVWQSYFLYQITNQNIEFVASQKWQTKRDGLVVTLNLRYVGEGSLFGPNLCWGADCRDCFMVSSVPPGTGQYFDWDITTTTLILSYLSIVLSYIAM
jgi:hypothetical protein